MDAELVRRIAFAAVAIPLALLVVWYGGLPLAALLAAASALGTGELFGLAERQGVRPARILGAVSAAAIAPLAYLAMTEPTLRAAAGRGGLLVGGPKMGGNTKDAWEDVEDDYQVNEVAINWTGAIVYGMAAFLQ